MTRETDLDGDDVAIEHCLWAASQGLRPDDVIASVGKHPPDGGESTWHAAQFAVTAAWNALRPDGANLPEDWP